MMVEIDVFGSVEILYCSGLNFSIQVENQRDYRSGMNLNET